MWKLNTPKTTKQQFFSDDSSEHKSLNKEDDQFDYELLSKDTIE